jgi:hypothetical protein
VFRISRDATNQDLVDSNEGMIDVEVLHLPGIAMDNFLFALTQDIQPFCPFEMPTVTLGDGIAGQAGVSRNGPILSRTSRVPQSP